MRETRGLAEPFEAKNCQLPLKQRGNYVWGLSLSRVTRGPNKVDLLILAAYEAAYEQNTVYQDAWSGQ